MKLYRTSAASFAKIIGGKMEAAFWQERWQQNKIAFHEAQPNALLSAHWSRLSLKQGSRVFVPLCGKTTDLAWLAARGHHVVGIELNQAAVDEVFRTMGLDPAVSRQGDLIRYQSRHVVVFVGDFFDFSPDLLGSVDAVYDRAALVALPPEMREAYSRHLTTLAGRAPQFLISYDYDQSQTEGPPFSVTSEEIGELYGDQYEQELVASVEISGRLAERCSGTENAWLLTST
ncbi:MAG: thiopurine S-methyltransferase [Geminicoccaceae bacterium]